MSTLPPRPEGGKDEDAPAPRDFMDLEDDCDDDSLSFPSILREVAILHIFMEFVVAIEERSVNLPVGNVMTFFEHVPIVNEYLTVIE